MSLFKSITVQDLKTKLDNGEDFTLIDIREKQELAICKIPDAIHIPMQSISDVFNKINFDKPVVIMCKSGGRSAQVCDFLNAQGYFDIYNLYGGIISWAIEIDSNMDVY